MANQIRITPDQMRERANQYRAEADTVNGVINTEEFSWIDLVGLRRRSMPTGQEETYEYDSHNRLAAVKDSDGRKTVSFLYHLRHE